MALSHLGSAGLITAPQKHAPCHCSLPGEHCAAGQAGRLRHSAAVLEGSRAGAGAYPDDGKACVAHGGSVRLCVLHLQLILVGPRQALHVPG